MKFCISSIFQYQIYWIYHFFIIFDSPRHWGGQVGARGEDGAQGVEA